MSPSSTHRHLDPGDYWTPTEGTVKEVRRLLTTKLREICEPEASGLGREIANYNCQHIGLTEDANRFILTMCMCRVEEDWKSVFASVIEGGSCYVEASTEVSNADSVNLILINIHDSLGVQECPDYFSDRVRQLKGI